jgi:hypothetical protein
LWWVSVHRILRVGRLGWWGLRLTLLAMLPDMDAMRTMLPWILFATMSFATALAVMKDPARNNVRIVF